MPTIYEKFLQNSIKQIAIFTQYYRGYNCQLSKHLNSLSNEQTYIIKCIFNNIP